MRNIICFYGPVARCDDDRNPFELGEPASNCTSGTVPKDGLCGYSSSTLDVDPPVTVPETEIDISTPAVTDPTTPSETPIDQDESTTPPITTTTAMEDCRSLGRTCKPQEVTSPSIPITTTEPSTTTPVIEGCGSLGRTCRPDQEEETITPDPEEVAIPSDPITTTPGITIPPTPAIGNVSVPAPCNSTSPTETPINSNDPQEILMAVFRYICKLLAVTPQSIIATTSLNSTL